MIAADGVSVRRGGRTLLAKVTIGLAPGTLTAVLGPNGAGKTTLLHVLSGGLRPDAGAVTLDGAPMHGISGAALARRRAVLGQHQPLEFGLRCRDVVALGRLPFAGHAGARDDATAVAAARATFGLEALWERLHTTLSGGERQRVHLARVAAQLWRRPGEGGASALLLDEPTAALDLGQQHVALRFALDRARAGAAVLAVLHDLNQAALADRVVLLRDGRVLMAGAPGEVLQPGPLRECFGVEVELLPRRDGGIAFAAVPGAA